VRDAVGASDRLRTELSASIERVLSEAPAPTGDVYVGWVPALDASACPARFRGQGEGGWGFPGWTPATAGATIGRAALDRCLDDGDDGADAALPAPLESVRAWMRATGAEGAPGVAGWVGDLRSAEDGVTLAAAAAAATRWLAGFVRVLGWPLPDGLALLNVTRDVGASGPPKWWPAKGSAVTVAGGADARLGRVTGAGTYSLLVHRPGSRDDRDVHRRASFEAAAGALAYRVAPDAVVVTSGDTGERARVPVDEALLAEGGAMIVEVVRQRVTALTRGFDPSDATPSSQCRWCDHQADCPPGTAWLAARDRWRGGLPVHAPVDVPVDVRVDVPVHVPTPRPTPARPISG
jgi:hypothetical protein